MTSIINHLIDSGRGWNPVLGSEICLTIYLTVTWDIEAVSFWLWHLMQVGLITSPISTGIGAPKQSHHLP
jgi:hypothetical protein